MRRSPRSGARLAATRAASVSRRSVLANDTRRDDEVRDLHGDAPLLSEASERRIDDAAAFASRRDETSACGSATKSSSERRFFTTG